MNKDVDERLVPNGQYWDARNIQVSTSEAADIGTVQNLLGNAMLSPNYQPNAIGMSGTATCVGAVSDEKNDTFYWLINESIVNDLSGTAATVKNMILQYKENSITPVFVDIQSSILTGSSAMFTPADGNNNSLTLTHLHFDPSDANLANLAQGMNITNIYGDISSNGVFEELEFNGIITNVDVSTGIVTINVPFWEMLTEVFGGVIPQFSWYALASWNKPVLSFKRDILVTGLNIIDDMLFWVDGHYDSNGELVGSEPKKINIPRSILGTTNIFTHTDFINETLGTSVPVEEKHITVIKEAPKLPPSMTLESTKPSEATMGMFETTFEDVSNNPGELLIPGDSMWIWVKHSISNGLTPLGTQNNLDINVGDLVAIERKPDEDVEIRFPLREPLVVGKITSTGAPSSLPDANGVFTTTLQIEIVSISPKTLIGNFDYLIDLKINNVDNIFKFKFPKFGLRYKYQDNEYSVFSPFTQTAFVPLSWDYQPKKGLNVGMQNHLKQATLTNIKPPNIPDGVIQIDILYKESGSSNIYLVDQIKPNDGTGHWNNNEYIIDSELIYAVIAENQILRHYDNIPKVARAQEITGSRIVYGNYKQNYTTLASYAKPRFDISLAPHTKKQDGSPLYGYYEHPYEWDGTLVTPLRSIKSLREYQFGVVFEDKYGRQSPVMTSSQSTLKVPKSESGNTNLIDIKIINDPPPWADSFRFFIKEPSTEYYNLAMDRWYNAEDGNVWLSFPSLDRNKLTEESTIILKKNINSNIAITDTAEYKVIAISNEVPDFVKNTKISYGIESHASYNLLGTTPPVPMANAIYLSNQALDSSSSDLIHAFEDWEESNLKKMWLRFQKTTVQKQTSNWYEISVMDTYVANSTSTLAVKIHGVFGDDMAFMDNSGAFCNGAAIEIARSVETPYAAFDGRFFVKILKDSALEQSILQYEYDGGYSVIGILSARFLRYDGEHHTEAAFNNYLSSPGNPNWDIGSNPNIGTFQTYGNNGGGFGFLPTVNNPAYEDYNGISEIGTNADYRKGESFMDPRWRDITLNSVVGNEFWHMSHGGNTWSHGYDNANYPNPIGNVAPTNIYPKDYPYMLGAFQTAGCYDEVFGSSSPHTNPPYKVHYTRSVVRDGDFWKSFADQTGDHTGMGHWFIDMEPTMNFPAKSWNNGVEVYYEKADGTSASPDNGSNDRGLMNTPGVGARIGSKRMDISYVGPDYMGGTVDFDEFINQQTHDFLTSFNAPFIFNGDPGEIVYKIVDYRIVENITNVYNDFDCENTAGKAAYHWNWSNSSGVHRVRYELLLDQVIGTTVQDQGIITPQEYVDAGGTPDETYNHAVAGNGNTSGAICCNGTPVYAHHYTFWPLDYSVTGIVPNPNYDPAVQYPPTFDNGCYAGGTTVMQTCPQTHGAFYDQADPNNPKWSNMIDIDPLIWTNKDGSTRLGYVPTQSSPSSGTATNRDIAFGNVIDLEPGNWMIYAAHHAMNIGMIMQSLWGSAGFGQPEYEASINPAIWETIPPDPADLELYYEASQSYPIKMFNRFDTVSQLGLEYGAIISCYDCASGAIIPDDCGFAYFQTNMSRMYVTASNGGGLLKDDVIKITNSDGSYITVVVAEDSTSLGHIIVDPNIYNNNFGLTWHNCFAFGNGVESDRISDTFNSDILGKGVKVSTILEKDYEEEHRKYGLIHSGIYNSTSGVNNLNQFITAEKITKDINPIYGSIQKLHSRNTDLVTLCEDKVLKILADKDAVFNADGNLQLTATGNVLGQTIPFVGEYGISKNPESFASEAYRAYFTDKTRGSIMRLSKDGLTPISDHGMKDWFKDNLVDNKFYPGSYDDKKEEYNITINSNNSFSSETVTFREDVKGWVSFKSFIPEYGISCANQYYTFKEGKAWRHHDENVNRNNFYGTPSYSSVSVYLNDFPSIVKSFETLNYEGTESRIIPNFQDDQYYNLQDQPGWYVDKIRTDMETGSVDEFIEKEGKWFNYIKGVPISTGLNNQIVINQDGNSSFDQDSFAVQGIGILNVAPVISNPLGCTDPTAFNFNDMATIDDGSCEAIVNGCMEPTASNFNASVNTDDNSCFWTGCTCLPAWSYPEGCQNTTAFPSIAYTYFQGASIIDDGNCVATIPGCTDCGSYWESQNPGQYCNGVSPSWVDGAFNYDPNANFDDGSCVDLYYGCTEESATNFDVLANFDPGYCTWYGCTNPLSSFYHLGAAHGPDQGTAWPDAALTYVPYNNSGGYGMIDDGSCVDVGCPDSGDSGTGATGSYDATGNPIVSTWPGYPATEYDASAGITINDGSCTWPSGCAIYYATNFNANTPVGYPGWDDGCIIPGCNLPLAMNHDCATAINAGSLTPCSDNVSVNDGSCIFNTFGCTDATACNYDSSVYTDDGSCEWTTCAGCMDPIADNYGSPNDGCQAYNTASQAYYPASCTIACDDSSPGTQCCDYTVYGCTDPNACNLYGGNGDPNPGNLPGNWTLVDDGSCNYFGCTDPTALNYLACATVDDGSCVYAPSSGCTRGGTNMNNWFTAIGDGGALSASTWASIYGGDEIPGQACNYDPTADEEDGSCIWGFQSLTIGNPNAVDVSGQPITQPQPMYYYQYAPDPSDTVKHYLHQTTPSGTQYPIGCPECSTVPGMITQYGEQDIGLRITSQLPNMQAQYDSGDHVVVKLWKRDPSGNWNITPVIKHIDPSNTTDGFANATSPNGAILGDREDPAPFNPYPWGPAHDDASNYEFDVYKPGVSTTFTSDEQEYAVEVYTEKGGVNYGLNSSSTAACGIWHVFTFGTAHDWDEHPGVVEGCTDGNACNYNPSANYDSGDCYYPTAVWWECDPQGGNGPCTECYQGQACGTTPVCSGATYSSLASCNSACGAN